MTAKTQPEIKSFAFDEHTPESFDEDSVNLCRVASGRLDVSKRLRIAFHKSYVFDSNDSRRRADQIDAARREFQRIAG